MCSTWPLTTHEDSNITEGLLMIQRHASGLGPAHQQLNERTICRDLGAQNALTEQKRGILQTTSGTKVRSSVLPAKLQDDTHSQEPTHLFLLTQHK